MFLELVRKASENDPRLARAALKGLRAYASAPRDAEPALQPEVARIGGACLRDHGGKGPPVVLIPSLINPPRILDLDPDVSVAAAAARTGRRTLLLDWGKADQRAGLGVGGHIEELLLPLLDAVGEPSALLGYCLGGTMALAAANLIPCERLITLACPWHFDRYPERSRAALQDMWRQAQASAAMFGALPMEVLQAAFWSLDPERTVRKFAAFAELPPDSPQASRFVELEDWANEGDPLPYPAATELIEGLFGRDLSGSGEWKVAGRVMADNINVPTLHILAGADRIAPPETAPSGPSSTIDAGHVGMIVGSGRASLHQQLRAFLDPACR